MPTLSVESPNLRQFSWSIEPGFGVILGSADVRKRRDKEMILGIPAGVTIKGSEPRVLRTPIHWQIMRDTLTEADQMVLFTGALLRVDGSRSLVIRTADTIASQWAGLFYQAHPRVILRPNSPGDVIIFNDQKREEPLALPFHDGQKVSFSSTQNTFAGRVS